MMAVHVCNIFPWSDKHLESLKGSPDRVTQSLLPINSHFSVPNCKILSFALTYSTIISTQIQEHLGARDFHRLAYPCFPFLPKPRHGHPHTFSQISPTTETVDIHSRVQSPQCDGQNHLHLTDMWIWRTPG